MTYDDGTIARVGDIVAVASGEGPESYIVIGPDQGNFAKLLLVGTVQKEDSPLFGQTTKRRGTSEACGQNDVSLLGHLRASQFALLAHGTEQNANRPADRSTPANHVLVGTSHHVFSLGQSPFLANHLFSSLYHCVMRSSSG